MKNITGIIAEYNPFHNGHAYHILQAKKKTDTDTIIVVMSGDFTQRGEPAIVDKFHRTEMALLSGVSIVIEIPVIFATSSAENFALSSVDLLNQTGIVNALCFGSEADNLQLITNIADLFCREPEDFKSSLQSELKTGVSFARARSNAAIKSLSGKNNELQLNDILSQPNNILSIEYLKAIKQLNSTILPYTVLRKGAGYNSQTITSSFSSATAVRNAAFTGDFKTVAKAVPPYCLSILKTSHLSCLDDYSLLLHSALLRSSSEQLSNILDMTEGLENRFIDVAKQHYKASEIVASVKSKRFTLSKVRRAALHTLMGIEKDYSVFYGKRPAYIRVLGFRKDAIQTLKSLMENALLPVVINAKEHKTLRQTNPLAYRQMSFDIISSELYRVVVKKPKSEYSIPVVIV